MAGALASAMLWVGPAHAGDDDLDTRVSTLEQSLANRSKSNLDLLNKVQDLQSQLQQEQGQIEELQHQLQQAGDQSKAQYLDLDSRIGRLEGTGAAVAAKSDAAKPEATSKPEVSPKTPSSGNAKADYDKAIDTLRAGHYADAGQQFGDFLRHYPKDPLVPNALYWQGESYYATARYQDALTDFQQLLQQYPSSDKASDALLKLGYTQDQLKQTPAARATLQSVISKYPNSKVAGLAKDRLQSIELQSAAQ